MTNFFDALKLVEKQEKPKLEFRLYYDPESSKPIFYTMDNEEGKYILVTKEEFAEARMDVVVKDGKIEKVSGISVGKLVPSPKGFGFGTLEDDVSIVGKEKYWLMKTYDAD